MESEPKFLIDLLSCGVLLAGRDMRIEARNRNHKQVFRCRIKVVECPPNDSNHMVHFHSLWRFRLDDRNWMQASEREYVLRPDLQLEWYEDGMVCFHRGRGETYEEFSILPKWDKLNQHEVNAVLRLNQNVS
ncbi:MAG: hypothetical protein K0S38_283 [Candidatus Paceibacter sp.]|jgi:hypothetical protein|nr:hypothetical protein [Candidatus Paceibacter sp.]